MTHKNLKKLKMLTDKLPDFSELVNNSQNNKVDYSVAGGTCFAFGLLKQKEVAVMNMFISKGTKFPKHKHKEAEFSIWYKGRAEMSMNGVKKICKAGDVLYIPPNVVHSGIPLEDCWAVVVSIPAIGGYPDV